MRVRNVCTCDMRMLHTHIIHTFVLPTLQVKVYRQHGDVIIQDCTFKTSRENRPFFAAVVVDGEFRCVTTLKSCLNGSRTHTHTHAHLQFHACCWRVHTHSAAATHTHHHTPHTPAGRASLRKRFSMA